MHLETYVGVAGFLIVGAVFLRASMSLYAAAGRARRAARLHGEYVRLFAHFSKLARMKIDAGRGTREVADPQEGIEVDDIVGPLRRFRNLSGYQGAGPDHIARNLVFQRERAVDPKRRADAPESRQALDGRRADIQAVAIVGVVDIDHIQVESAEMCVGRHEQPEHIFITGVAREVVPVKTVPGVETRDPKVRCARKRYVVADKSHRIDCVVD